MRGVVDAERHAHFAGGDHVDGRLVLVEHVEHLAHEAAGQKHARTHNFDGRDVVLRGHGLNAAFLQVVVDEGAGSRRLHRVLEAHRHSGIACGLHTGGVQNLGTEIGQFGRLLKVQLAHGGCAFHKSWVVVVHAVDVRPNLDFVGPYGRANERGGVVRPSALQVVDGAISIAADEALGDVDVIVGVAFQQIVQSLSDESYIRFAVVVQSHVFERREQASFHTDFFEVVGHHVGAHDFTLGEDDLLIGIGKLSSTEVVQLQEDVVEHFDGLLAHLFCVVQLGYVLVILPAQGVDHIACAFGVALAEIVGNLYQTIGGSAHSRKHHDFLFAIFCDEAAHFLHSVGRAHRGATKLIDFHVLMYFQW